MVPTDAFGVLVGAVALGTVHGIEPGHGWPVAASYALDQANKWRSGIAASLVLSLGHLVSSVAMVGVVYYAKGYLGVARYNRPITLFDGVTIGGPVSVVAGCVLVALGIREYVRGHANMTQVTADGAQERAAAGGSDDHDSKQVHTDGHGHHHDRLDKHRLSLSHNDYKHASARGLLGIAWYAFFLGFGHGEELQIFAMCAGSEYCPALLASYALAVLVGIVGLTLLLLVSYEYFEQRIERFSAYLPELSALILVGLGFGFVTGVV
jgi:ABC-type nickel/cobalt efflux system permease component RcnA